MADETMPAALLCNRGTFVPIRRYGRLQLFRPRGVAGWGGSDPKKEPPMQGNQQKPNPGQQNQGQQNQGQQKPGQQGGGQRPGQQQQGQGQGGQREQQDRRS